MKLSALTDLIFFWMSNLAWSRGGGDYFHLRQVSTGIAKAEWLEGAVGGLAELLPLPPLMDHADCRFMLRQAQLSHCFTSAVIRQKRAELDPKLSKQSNDLTMPRKPAEA